MDLVLGVSMAPTTVRMVLIEGENADGLTVEQDTFPVTGAFSGADDAPIAAALGGPETSSAADQVIGAIVGTRQSAAEGGHQLRSAGVTWTDPTEVRPLRDALAAQEIRGVMLVSPLLAAAALAQTVGYAMGYNHLAMLFVEPRGATLAVVEVSDGSIVDLHRRPVDSSEPGEHAAAELAAMLGALDTRPSRVDGVFVVGCGVDIVPIKSALEPATSLAVIAPEEPDMALARGAALASANAPLFASSTAALAYALDPGTGAVNPGALAPGYLDAPAATEPGPDALAYSALLDEDSEQSSRRRRHFTLAGGALAAVAAIGVTALVISLASDVRPNSPAPAAPPPPAAAPASPPATAAPAPPPAAAPAPAPETVAAPPLVQQPPPSAAPMPPIRKAPEQLPPQYVVPAPAEQAPAPAPAAPAPVAPVPAPPPAAPAAPPAQPQVPARPPMTAYLHLPFVTVPIPINPPPPPGAGP